MYFDNLSWCYCLLQLIRCLGQGWSVLWFTQSQLLSVLFVLYSLPCLDMLNKSLNRIRDQNDYDQWVWLWVQQLDGWNSDYFYQAHVSCCPAKPSCFPGPHKESTWETIHESFQWIQRSVDKIFFLGFLLFLVRKYSVVYHISIKWRQSSILSWIFLSNAQYSWVFLEEHSLISSFE